MYSLFFDGKILPLTELDVTVDCVSYFLFKLGCFCLNTKLSLWASDDAGTFLLFMFIEFILLLFCCCCCCRLLVTLSVCPLAFDTMMRNKRDTKQKRPLVQREVLMNMILTQFFLLIAKKGRRRRGAIHTIYFNFAIILFSLFFSLAQFISLTLALSLSLLPLN